MSASIFRHAAQGNGPLAESFVVPSGAAYRVISVELHLNAACTTQAEYLTVTHDSIDSALCDTVIYRIDLASSATVDLLWQPDGDFYLLGGDGLDVDWVNTQGRTWGLMVTMEAQ
jgi:hypothetical protein